MKKYLINLLFIGVFFSTIATAQELTQANEIIRQANLASYYQGDDGRAQARMLIVDSQGNKQMRQFTILRKDQQDLGNQDMLVFFSRPTDVKGTVFRVNKKPASDDDRWLYLPALDLVKRISAGDKRTSFVGAHYFYEDVSGRNPDEDNFTLLESNKTVYRVKAEPKKPNSVEFSYYIAEIDKQTFLPMKVSYYGAKNKIIREMEVLKTQVVNKFPTVMHAKITSLSDGSYTEMRFKNVQYNIGLPSAIFSERSLRKPPKKWLK